MSAFVIRFLSRPGCLLCEEARPLVLGVAKRSGVTVEEVNIDEDDELVVSYGLRIPVVLGPGDEVVAEGIIDDTRVLRSRLRELLKR